MENEINKYCPECDEEYECDGMGNSECPTCSAELIIKGGIKTNRPNMEKILSNLLAIPDKSSDLDELIAAVQWGMEQEKENRILRKALEIYFDPNDMNVGRCPHHEECTHKLEYVTSEAQKQSR